MPVQPMTVEAHLREEYRGVFGERQLERHVRDHLGLEEATGQVDLVLERTAGAGRVLDLGCGYGSFVAAATHAGLDAVGIDISAYELGYARTRPDVPAGPAVARGDAGRLPFPDDTFDLVTLWNVLEHLPDAHGALVEVSRVLRPRGQVFILAPNYAAFRMEAHYHVPWLPLLRGRAAVRWLRLWGRDPAFWQHQVRPCTARATTRTLVALGFTVDDFLIAKLEDASTIHSRWKRAVIDVAGRTGLRSVVRVGLRLRSGNPLRASLTIQATLGDAR